MSLHLIQKGFTTRFILNVFNYLHELPDRCLLNVFLFFFFVLMPLSFDLFQMKVEDYAGMGKEVEGMKPEMWLRCAQNSSAFQDFDKAVEFGAKALAVNRLHGETRAFLSQNSEAHRAIFLKEKRQEWEIFYLF